MLPVALAVSFYFVSRLFGVLSSNWRATEPIPSEKWESKREEATALHPHTEKDSEQSSGGLAAIRVESGAFEVLSNKKQRLPPSAPTSHSATI